MLVVYRPSYRTKTVLSASLRMSFAILICGLFVGDVIQTVFASPEPKKLTNEEVLKELGVEIKMKVWRRYASGTIGSLVELPCNTTSPLRNDNVKLVLWFRNDSAIPFYTYDNRKNMGSTNINKNGKHWSDKNFFGSRALFTENSKPPSLALDDLQISDDGIYKCRVDFKLAQTSITRVKLTVIVPPSTPQILVQQRVNSYQISLRGPPGDDTFGAPRLGDHYSNQPFVTNKDSSKNGWTVSNENIKTKHIKDEYPNAGDEESEEYDSDYEDPLAIFIPVSYRGVQNVNHMEISPSSKSKPTVYDTSLLPKYPSATIGPYQLGEDVVLRCISRGGQPLPNVTWWKDNSLLVDDSFYFPKKSLRLPSQQNFVVNDVVIKNLQRHHLNSKLTCRADNSKHSPPSSATVSIDMKFGPSAVRIKYDQMPLSVGKSYKIQCEAIGSKPMASISWWIDEKQIHTFVAKSVYSIGSNITISTLTFTPRPKDNGRLLACQAKIKDLPESGLDSKRKLVVYYPPTASLKLGTSLNASNIKEGDDVYFECSVNSNPRPNKIIWKKDGNIVEHSIEDGIISSNQSLVLQRISKISAGNYTCTAFNSEGSGLSNHVKLNIKYKPFCRKKQQDVYGVATGEEIRISCDVFADPSQSVMFEWVFNTSTEWVQKKPENVIGINSRHGGWTRSYAHHTPKNEMDFGSLMCRATNEIGTQENPCIFHLMPAGKPDPVYNCSESNQSYSTMSVTCKKGFNGGLKQVFNLLVQDSSTGKLVMNKTNPTSPSFYLTGLKPDTGYRIIIAASNAKGYSAKVELQAYTIKSDGLTQLIETNESALATNMDDMIPVNPFLIITLIVVGVFMSVFLPISIVVCVRKRKRNSRQQIANNQSNPINNSGVTNNSRSNQHVIRNTSENNQSSLKLLNSADDIFSEFEDTGSNSFSTGMLNSTKKTNANKNNAGPDLIPSYTSTNDNGQFLLAKTSLPTAPSTVGPVRRNLSPLHSNLLDFGGLTAHRKGTRDGSTLLCNSTSEIRQSNRVTYEENVEEESGGFEEGGEKTRFGTLQRQRKQLNNDFRANSNTNRSIVHGNQNPSLYGSGYDRGSSCGDDAFLNPHSAFESSSDKLLGNMTPTRGLTTHQNQLSSPRVFSSISSADGLSPTSSSLLGTSTQPSFSSVSPTSNLTKTNDTPTPTESFTSSMTSGTGTLRQYPCSNNFLNGQVSSMSSNITTETTPTSASGENEECSINARNELASSAASQKLQIITRVRNLTTIQQGGPAKLSTYKMRTLHNGQNGDQSNISDSTINSSRESKV